MYAIQNTHIQPASYLANIKKIGNALVNTLTSIDRSLRAARYTMQNPMATDKDTVLRILEGK